MQQLPDKILLDTNIPSDTLKKLSQSTKLDQFKIQQKFTNYIIMLIRAYLYNLLSKNKQAIRVWFPSINYQAQKSLPLSQSVSNCVIHSDVSPNTIAVVYPKTSKRAKVPTNPISTSTLAYNLTLYIKTLEQIMFSKYLPLSLIADV